MSTTNDLPFRGPSDHTLEVGPALACCVRALSNFVRGVQLSAKRSYQWLHEAWSHRWGGQGLTKVKAFGNGIQFLVRLVREKGAEFRHKLLLLMSDGGDVQSIRFGGTKALTARRHIRTGRNRCLPLSPANTLGYL